MKNYTLRLDAEAAHEWKTTLAPKKLRLPIGANKEDIQKYRIINELNSRSIKYSIENVKKFVKVN